jgi:hypothetical protein
MRGRVRKSVQQFEGSRVNIDSRQLTSGRRPLVVVKQRINLLEVRAAQARMPVPHWLRATELST